VSKEITKTPLRVIAGRVNTFEYNPPSMYWLFIERMFANGIREARISDEWNDYDGWKFRVGVAHAVGMKVILNLIYSVSPKHSDEYFAERTRQAASLKPYRLCLKDPGGLLTPERMQTLVVLAAQAAAIAAVGPGGTWQQPHDAAVGVLAQGFIDLGLLSGSLDQIIETEAYKKFYMHRTGHWLGLDVHDAGEYKRDGEWRKLQAGMVLTVEPGCYIRAAEGVPDALAGIGIRIEDDVLVTADGREVLSSAAPKSVAEIEDWMRSRHE
jgi:hypothetical protein